MQHQQQPTSIGTSNALQRSEDRSPTTTIPQQQQTSTGGASSTMQGQHGLGSSTAQDQRTAIGPSKTHPTNPLTGDGKHGHRKKNIHGNVFARLQHYSRLPPDLQQDTKEFEGFVEKHPEVVFGNNKHALIKTVYGVKGKELVDAIIQWLEARDAHQPTPGQGQGQAMMPSAATMATAGGEPFHSNGDATTSSQNVPGQSASDFNAPGVTTATPAAAGTDSGTTYGQQSPNILPGTEVSQGSSGAQTTGLTGNNNNNNNVGQTHHHGLTGTHDNTRGTTGDHAHHGPMDTIRATAHGPRGANVPAQEENAGNRGHHMPFSHGDATHGRSSSSRANHLHRAREIAEALVFSGFITPYKDVEKHTSRLKKHYVTDHELFVPVGKNVTELHTTSVWSVVDGTTYAVSLKRKAGLMGVIADGKDVYVAFNEHNNMAYLFESDVARDVISQIHGETVTVQFENDHFPFGVLVESSLGDEKMKPELFNAESKRVQEEFVNAWLSIGAQYRENSIKRIVEAESQSGGLAGAGVAGKNANANPSTMTPTGQQEVRGADLAAVGAGAGAGIGGGAATNQANKSAGGTGINNTTTNNNAGIGANDGLPTTTTQRDHHSTAKDALYGAGAAAGAGGAMAHHGRHSADREGQFNDTSYGNTTTYPPNDQDHHFASRQDPSPNETSFGTTGAQSKHHLHGDRHSTADNDRSLDVGQGAAAGAALSQHHHDHHLGARDHQDPITESPYGYAATSGSKGQHDHQHHLGRHDDPNYNEAGYGSGAASSQRQDQHFGGAQDGPSLAAPFGGGAAAADTQSKHHHDRDHHDRDHYLGGHHQDPAYDAPYGGDSATMGSKHHHDRHVGGKQDDPSPARHMADLAAAKIAGIEPTDQYQYNNSSGAAANQGSAAPSSSKYQQEYPVGGHDTRTAP